MTDKSAADALRAALEAMEQRGQMGDGISAATWRQAASMLRAALASVPDEGPLYEPDSELADLHRLIDEWHQRHVDRAFAELPAASATDEGPHYERFGDAYVASPAVPALDVGPDNRMACAVLVNGSLADGVLIAGTDYRVIAVRERWEPSPDKGDQPTITTVVRFDPVIRPAVPALDEIGRLSIEWLREADRSSNRENETYMRWLAKAREYAALSSKEPTE